MPKDSLTIPVLDGGQVTYISPLLLDPQKGFSRSLRNVDVNAPGVLRKRPGVQTVLSAPAATVNGCYEYVKLTTGVVYKLAAHGTLVQRWDVPTLAWVNVRTGLTSAKEHDFITFADKVAMVNLSDASALWDGTTVTTPTDFPKCSNLSIYRLRIVASGISGDTSLLQLSHTADPTVWDPDATGSNAFKVYVSPDDGEGITGTLPVGEAGLLIGKKSSLYGLFGYTRKDFTIDQLDPSMGSHSHKAMVYVRPYAYFVNPQGIWRLQFGSEPERISEPIQDVFDDNVDVTALSSARARSWKRYYIITLPKTSGSITLAYHVDKGKWSEWDHPSIGYAMRVSNDSTSELYYTEPAGKDFFRFRPGLLTDKTLAINARVQTLELDGGNAEVEKDFYDIYIEALGRGTASPYELVVSCRTDEETDWRIYQAISISKATGDRVIFRVPIGVTARFLSVRIENTQASQEFSPLALTYYYDLKGVR